MNFETGEKQDITRMISIDKLHYCRPELLVLSSKLVVHSGASSNQIENTSGVFNTHS
jgi:hypothetical protein